MLAVWCIAFMKTGIEDNKPGRKLREVYSSSLDCGMLTLLEKQWRSGSLKWKVYSDEDDLNTQDVKPKTLYVAPDNLSEAELLSLQEKIIRNFMTISSNARKKEITDLRKELEPVFREARSYADETGADLMYSLKKLESMK